MKKLFYQMGADEKEMNTFLKLLELGAQPISVVAKHMSIPRSSMYTILDRLKKLELVEEFERAGIKYVKCIPVKEIKNVLLSRENEIEETIKTLGEQLPLLERIENTMTITPKISFFEGKEAVGRMYRKILEQKEFWATFNPKMVQKIMPHYLYTISEGVKAQGGRAKELLIYSREAREYKKKYQSKKHQIKIFDRETSFEADTIITPDAIYMVSYGEDSISAVEIINASLAKAQRCLFEKVWGTIK